jgi:hypothetical protein
MAAETNIDPLTDTGKIRLVVKEAVHEALQEERKRFDPLKFIVFVCNTIVSEIAARNK